MYTEEQLKNRGDIYYDSFGQNELLCDVRNGINSDPKGLINRLKKSFILLYGPDKYKKFEGKLNAAEYNAGRFEENLSNIEMLRIIDFFVNTLESIKTEDGAFRKSSFSDLLDDTIKKMETDNQKLEQKINAILSGLKTPFVLNQRLTNIMNGHLLNKDVKGYYSYYRSSEYFDHDELLIKSYEDLDRSYYSNDKSYDKEKEEIKKRYQEENKKSNGRKYTDAEIERKAIEELHELAVSHFRSQCCSLAPKRNGEEKFKVVSYTEKNENGEVKNIFYKGCSSICEAFRLSMHLRFENKSLENYIEEQREKEGNYIDWKKEIEDHVNNEFKNMLMNYSSFMADDVRKMNEFSKKIIELRESIYVYGMIREYIQDYIKTVFQNNQYKNELLVKLNKEIEALKEEEKKINKQVEEFLEKYKKDNKESDNNNKTITTEKSQNVSDEKLQHVIETPNSSEKTESSKLEEISPNEVKEVKRSEPYEKYNEFMREKLDAAKRRVSAARAGFDMDYYRKEVVGSLYKFGSNYDEIMENIQFFYDGLESTNEIRKILEECKMELLGQNLTEQLDSGFTCLEELFEQRLKEKLEDKEISPDLKAEINYTLEMYKRVRDNSRGFGNIEGKKMQCKLMKQYYFLNTILAEEINYVEERERGR